MTAADHANTEPACPNCGMTARVSPSRKQPGRWWCDECAAHFDQFPEGDPAVVRPPDPLAESQAALNGPSGSPTSPSGRVTAADHATTVREALQGWDDPIARESFAEPALAALDALVAQAEAAEEMEGSPSYHWYYRAQEERERAVAAEAERDQALKDAADYLAHVHRLEAERDRLADALRRSSLSYHKSNSHPRDFEVCTWPQCRKARAVLARTEDTP